jgi:hypothetical protein
VSAAAGNPRADSAAAAPTETAAPPICTLCKRRFASAEMLDKHERLSDLHRVRTQAWRLPAR